jgi:hypothetical protein
MNILIQCNAVIVDPGLVATAASNQAVTKQRWRDDGCGNQIMHAFVEGDVGDQVASDATCHFGGSK